MSLKENEPFAGEVEVDESYFGARRIRGKRGRGASGKTPVVGLLKRDGKVFVQIINDCSSKELLPVIKGQVLEDATIYTDGWRAYDCLIREGYKHHRIHHHRSEPSGASINLHEEKIMLMALKASGALLNYA